MKPNSAIYEIRLEGLVDVSWVDWFSGMAIFHENSIETILVGELPDQSALYGVVDRIQDLGLTLISMRRIDRDQPDDPIQLDDG